MEHELNAIRRQQYTEIALEILAAARDLLAIAGAPRTLKRVRAAISSAKGAVRNARGREMRAARAS